MSYSCATMQSDLDGKLEIQLLHLRCLMGINLKSTLYALKCLDIIGLC